MLSFRFLCYDCLTLFFLAASCASRGRVAGEPPTGCLLVGLFSALLWPLTRELFLHGSPVAVFSSLPLQASLMAGALSGTLFSCSLRYFERLCTWTEIVALALAATFGALCAMAKLGPVPALGLALFLAAIPSAVCDVLLGAEARFLTASARLLRAFQGAILATAAMVLAPSLQFPLPDVLGVGIGLIYPLCVQLLRPR